jgi:hypothetical protein
LTLTLWLIVLLATLAGCTAAHAQPTSWQSHSDGYLTRYQGIDGNGEPWTGTSGFTTYFDANGPHGEQQLCRSWQEGWQTITRPSPSAIDPARLRSVTRRPSHDGVDNGGRPEMSG